MLPEVRMARIVEAIARFRSGELSGVEAADVVGLSERHFVGCGIAMRRRVRRGSSIVAVAGCRDGVLRWIASSGYSSSIAPVTSTSRRSIFTRC